MLKFGNKYKVIRENPYDNVPLGYNGLIIKSKWNENFSEIILKQDVKALFLNHQLGWSCKDYSFFKEIPKVFEVDIIDDHSNGINSIEYQDEVKDLGLNVPDAYSIDFRKFPKLSKLFLYGRKQNLTLYECESLEELYFDEVKIGDQHALGKLTNLRKLTIANSNLTALDFLNDLRNLETLEIFNCKKIKSFEPISCLKNVRRLHIAGFNDIGDISFLSQLHGLEILILEAGKVDSILPLKYLVNLKALAIYGKGSFISDWNVEIIKYLKRLSLLDIPNNKKYNFKINNHWNWKDIDKVKDNWLAEKS